MTDPHKRPRLSYANNERPTNKQPLHDLSKWGKISVYIHLASDPATRLTWCPLRHLTPSLDIEKLVDLVKELEGYRDIEDVRFSMECIDGTEIPLHHAVHFDSVLRWLDKANPGGRPCIDLLMWYQNPGPKLLATSEMIEPKVLTPRSLSPGFGGTSPVLKVEETPVANIKAHDNDARQIGAAAKSHLVSSPYDTDFIPTSDTCFTDRKPTDSPPIGIKIELGDGRRETSTPVTEPPGQNPPPSPPSRKRSATRAQKRYNDHKNALPFKLRVVEELSPTEAAVKARESGWEHSPLKGRTKNALVSHIRDMEDLHWNPYLDACRTSLDYTSDWTSSAFALLHELRVIEGKSINTTARIHRSRTGDSRSVHDLYVYIYAMDCEGWNSGLQ